MSWTSFGANTEDDAIDLARAAREKELARAGTLQAMLDEERGYLARRAIALRDLDSVTEALETAAPAYRALHEVERDRLLRFIDNMEARVDLVNLEIERKGLRDKSR